MSDAQPGKAVRARTVRIETVRRSLSDWLDWMGLMESGTAARLDRYIGYYEPYATSHDTLDHETALHEEVRNAARAVVRTAEALGSARLTLPVRGLKAPRPK